MTITGWPRWRCIPEIASFDCGSLNFGSKVFINSPSFLDMLAAEMIAQGVLPEIECFDTGHIWSAARLIDEGKLKPPFWFQMVLGVRGGAPGEVRSLVQMVDMLPKHAIWSCCGIGRAQLPLNLATIAMGGHVRTGLEDNIYYHKGQLAESNAQLVERVVRIAGEVGRPVASPAEARAILGLKTPVRAGSEANRRRRNLARDERLRRQTDDLRRYRASRTQARPGCPHQRSRNELGLRRLHRWRERSRDSSSCRSARSGRRPPA